MTDHTNTRMQRLGHRTPLDVAEPEQLVLVEYVSGGRVASFDVITSFVCLVLAGSSLRRPLQ